ncbi:hypothetical protein GCM10018966_054850 [Streptomyces yanii]
MRPSYWHMQQRAAATNANTLTASPVRAAHTTAAPHVAAPVPQAPRTREGPGAARRRGLSSPVPTWSPELSRSVPTDPHPRVVRLPEKISPPQATSILGRGHSNEGCCEPNTDFRIQVR